MRKRNKSQEVEKSTLKNPVAKFAFQFNKAQVFADKRKYQRKAKHSGLEPFSIVIDLAIEKGSSVNYFL
jgi:hypothetical protein